MDGEKDNDDIIETGVADIAASMGLGQPEDEISEETPEVETPETPEVVAAPVVRQPPQSWAKEHHEVWGKLDPKAQEYIEIREKQMLDGLGQYKEYHGLGKSIHDVITPYMPIIQAHGVEPAKAIQALFNTHYRITQGSLEQRIAAFQELGVGLGLMQKPQGAQVDPAIRALEERYARLEGAMTREQQQKFQEVQTRTSNEVKTFADAKDEKGNLLHPYFDDVADDIVLYIGNGLSLNDAYAKAVRANPVTYEKEVARLKSETEASLRVKSKQEAEAARKAAGGNVRSRDTRRAPTEPLGKMDDTLKETYRDINSRTH